MNSFIPILLLASLTLVAGAIATYYYLKVRSLELKLDTALKNYSNSIEVMQKQYLELTEQTAQRDVLSKEEGDKMMLKIREIVNRANYIKTERLK